ncbi:MAG: D-alanyl-D-alanine carboxypeptidase [Firmicutes bacterium]|nr:D-alanyl-D-alanine carboxypeptidase [Alicyclobacillaceae bacterium]MCL6496699.1 D-alanyl-D-alanine carboxypeptidase [Bacillota bacterium]
MWRWWSIGLAWALAGAFGGVAQAFAPPPSPPPPITAKAALLESADGQVLFAHNAHTPLPIASVTKLMTLYLVVRAVERGRIHLQDRVPVSEGAWRVGGSQIWLEPGERLTVDELLRAVAVGSANDAAYALGEYLAGSEEAFVAAMNRTAARLGMRQTHFQNPHGLHHPQHYATAYDLGLLARHAVRHPLLLRYTRQWQDRTLRNGKGGTLWLINQNRLLRTYPGTDGLKTGYTREAGFCLVATAVRDHTRLIAVVLGEPTSQARFADAAALLTWGFDHYQTVPVAKAGMAWGRVRVDRGAAEAVTAVAPHPVAVTVPKGEAPMVQVRASLPERVTAPVAVGQRLGTLTVSVGDRVVREVPLVAQAAVRRVSWPELFWRTWWQVVGTAVAPGAKGGAIP